jgi:AraC-like DNA-binding protein
LIQRAVAAFDEDRGSARTYLLKASALLQARDDLSSSRYSRSATQPVGGLAFWQIKRVVEYIEANFTQRIAAAELAAVINVSVGQLFRKFRISLGVSPFQYITKRRVDLACTLMKTAAEPLSQIALSCGLCDQSHLCRVFRRETGLSPSLWRKANANGPHAPCLGVMS